MRFVFIIFFTSTIAGCASLQPYGEDTLVTQRYDYRDSVKGRDVYSCIQTQLVSHEYFLEYGKLDNKYGINRFDITRKSENVASLEIYTGGSTVSSQAFVKNTRTRHELDAAQSYCVKRGERHTTMAEAIVVGLWEGLK